MQKKDSRFVNRVIPILIYHFARDQGRRELGQEGRFATGPKGPHN